MLVKRTERKQGYSCCARSCSGFGRVVLSVAMYCNLLLQCTERFIVLEYLLDTPGSSPMCVGQYLFSVASHESRNGSFSEQVSMGLVGIFCGSIDWHEPQYQLKDLHILDSLFMLHQKSRIRA